MNNMKHEFERKSKTEFRDKLIEKDKEIIDLRQRSENFLKNVSQNFEK